MSMMGDISNGGFKNAMSSILQKHISSQNKLVSSANLDNSSLSNIAMKMSYESRKASAGAQNGSLASSRQEAASQTLDEAEKITNRLSEIATKANDGTLQINDRKGLQAEADQLRSELGSLVGNASYNGQPILQGDSHKSYIDGSISYTDGDGSAIIGALTTFDLSSEATAQAALASVQVAQENLVSEQVKVETTSARLSRSSSLSEIKALQASSIADSENDPINAAMELQSALVEHMKNQNLASNVLKFYAKHDTKLI